MRAMNSATRLDLVESRSRNSLMWCIMRMFRCQGSMLMEVVES